MKQNNIPTAREMGSKLGSLALLLQEEKLISFHTKSYILEISKRLKELKQSKSWGYTIYSTAPVEFVPLKDKKLGQIAPRVYLTVAVSPQSQPDRLPFSQLVTVVEIWDLLTDQLQSRWHLDLANRKADGTYQAGPLFHLQGGGHKPRGDRAEDLKVSLPRWEMPPKELILICEMIIANFYPAKWEKISTQKKRYSVFSRIINN
jgi:hypothetical protein